MIEIRHRVGIAASAQQVYASLTTDEGLSGWWTRRVEGAGSEGSVIGFWFDETCVQFQVAELIPNKRVRWVKYGDTPEAWRGTEVSFELTRSEGQVFIDFRHSGWLESNTFMGHCSTKWAVFLLSLKDMLETGIGQPFPVDRHIDHSEY